LNAVVALTAVSAAWAQDQERVDLNVRDSDLADVLRILAEYEGVNVVIDSSIDDVVTLRLRDVPIDQAWRAVLETNGLERETIGEVAHIRPTHEVEEIVDTTPPSPLETRVIQLRHIVLSQFGGGEADVGIPTLGGGDAASGSFSSGASFISGGAAARTPTPSNIELILRDHLLNPDARIALDIYTNSVVVTDSPSNFRRIEELIAQLDQPIPQILIEASVVEGGRNFLHDFGIRWGGFGISSGADFSDPEGALYDGQSGSVYRGNFEDGSPTERIAGIDGPSYGDFNFAYLSTRYDINVRLTALESSGEAEVLSQPRILTLNNVQALIVDGDEIQIPSGISESGVTAFEARTAALQLRVTPQVYDGDGIRLALNVSRESINFGQIVNGTPVISTQVADCVVGMRTGETLVIGGILGNRETETVEAIPLLSKIPILGPLLFTHTVRDNEQTEVAIFVTPRIVRMPGEELPSGVRHSLADAHP
jgi:type IV pilus assembly protein PilQ